MQGLFGIGGKEFLGFSMKNIRHCVSLKILHVCHKHKVTTFQCTFWWRERILLYQRGPNRGASLALKRDFIIFRNQRHDPATYRHHSPAECILHLCAPGGKDPHRINNGLSAVLHMECRTTQRIPSVADFNQTESEVNLKDRYVKYVYDFATSQANGTIASICLTHKNGGLTSYGSKNTSPIRDNLLMQSIAEDNLQYVYPDRTGASTSSRYSGMTIGKTELIFLIDRAKDCVYYFKVADKNHIHITKRQCILKTDHNYRPVANLQFRRQFCQFDFFDKRFRGVNIIKNRYRL